MKFKFYQPANTEKEDLESVAGLHLEDDGYGNVNLVATMENDSEWYLLTLNSNGTFTRRTGINEDTGFKITKAGYLKEQK